MDLQGKKALITGGTRGIGRAIAHTFAQKGAQVAIYGTNTERGKGVLKELPEVTSGDHSFFCVDVSQKEEVEKRTGELLEAWGKIDILINCAGITRDKLLMRMPTEDWDDVINTNLRSVYLLSKSVIRSMMRSRSGKIVNITSVIGLSGNPGQTNYGASKAGIIGFTRSFAKEVAAKGIQVNSIAPGFIETDMTKELTASQKQEIAKRIPMGKLGTPQDIADAALFLASPLSNYITGTVLLVDGGMLS